MGLRRISLLAGLLGVAALTVPATATAGGGLTPTTTSVNCFPGDRVVGSIPTMCTATVNDNLGLISPTGNVSWSSDNPGAFTQGINPTTTCLLNSSGMGASFCQINYAPTAVGTGSHKLTAMYPGSGIHDASSGFFNLIVTAPPSDGGGGSGGGGTTTTPGPVSTIAPSAPAPKKCKKKKKHSASAAKKCKKKK